MRARILESVNQIASQYFTLSSLHTLIDTCMQEKQREGSRWSDITLTTYWMLGGTSEDIERRAALTEILMLALDIIDDLQDQDNPSKPWMTMPLPDVLSTLLSLFASFSMEAITRSDRQTLSKVTQLFISSINGQHWELGGTIRTEADYIRMVECKSGSLLRISCLMGYSLIPDLDPAIEQQMDDIATCIGVISQLENDLSDLLLFDYKNDLIERKRTLPIIFLLQECEHNFPQLLAYYEGKLPLSSFLELKKECLAFLAQSGCVEYTRIVQSLYIERVEELWSQLPLHSPWKEQFRTAVFGPAFDSMRAGA